MQLSYTEWLVGNGPTLADLALYAYTHVAHEGGFDLTPYDGIKAWLKQIETLEGYLPIDFRPRNAEHFVIRDRADQNRNFASSFPVWDLKALRASASCCAHRIGFRIPCQADPAIHTKTVDLRPD